MTTDELEQRERESLGIAHYPAEALPVPLSEFQLSEIQISEDGTDGSLIASAQDYVLLCPVVKREGVWYFGVGKVELRKAGTGEDQ